MPKTTVARRKANAKYDATNTTQVKFKFNNKTDADVIERLNEVPNKAGYVKSLIRADIKSHPTESDNSKS